jgi:uncharacterized protein with von Willebrand factor type A (vWA) domain
VAEHAAVALARCLRGEGLAVPVDATVTFARALGHVADRGRGGAYWAGRATLVRRPDDVPAYDRAFARWLGGAALPTPVWVHPAARVIEVAAGGEPPAAPAEDTQPDGAEVDGPAASWSATEVLRHRDLAACTPDERAEAHRLIADLRLRSARRPGRRQGPDRRPRAGAALDLRRTTRLAVARGGEVVRPETSSPRDRPVRVVLLLDVSGSMEPYARALARFAHAAVVARRHGDVEVFALGTRLTRITRALQGHDPDAALARATDAVDDWSGGTRLGDGLRAFNDEWGVRGMARGALVVVLSDGWDRGDPQRLGEEAARLRRVARRLVWVNPLKASPGYAPLAGGMAAALPHLDDLVEGHSVAALADLAELLAS